MKQISSQPQETCFKNVNGGYIIKREKKKKKIPSGLELPTSGCNAAALSTEQIRSIT